MSTQLICQSCAMPISDPHDRGTEKDGSLSTEYCKYCYKEGKYTEPDMTLFDMILNVTQEMGKQHLPDFITADAIGKIKTLKRWR